MMLRHDAVIWVVGGFSQVTSDWLLTGAVLWQNGSL